MKYINLKIPEHSYFFGFIQSDGNLKKASRNRGRLEIELAERDKDILLSFKKLFPTIYSAIRTRARDTNFKKNHKSAIFTVCSLEFRKEVNKLGLFYGKKFLNNFPRKSTAIY